MLVVPTIRGSIGLPAMNKLLVARIANADDHVLAALLERRARR